METLWAAEAAAEGGGSGMWQLAIVLAGIGLLGFFARWRRRNLPPLPSAAEMRERDGDPDRYRNAADKAIVELLETSRSLNAQVDTKIRLLNRLVKDAEEATARLERLLAVAGSAREEPAENSPDAAVDADPAPAPEPSFASELHERVFRMSREGKTAAEIAKATNLSTIEVKFALASLGDSNA